VTALEQAAELGRKAANALHCKRDQSLCRHFTTYWSKFVSCAKPEDCKGLVEAFNAAYRGESSYYIGR
jgi:hypothetical protein